MAELRRPQLRAPGFAPPPRDAAEWRGSESHRRALAIARKQWSRSWQLDAFHRVKLAYLVKQRHFPRRLANFLRYRRERGRVASQRHGQKTAENNEELRRGTMRRLEWISQTHRVSGSSWETSGGPVSCRKFLVSFQSGRLWFRKAG